MDLGQLAKDLPGLSGAELGNVLNESALEAVRREGSEVTQADVFNAVDRVLQVRGGSGGDGGLGCVRGDGGWGMEGGLRCWWW